MKKAYMLVQNFGYSDHEKSEYDGNSEPLGLYSTEHFAQIAGNLIGETSSSGKGVIEVVYNLTIHEVNIPDDVDLNLELLRGLVPRYYPEVCRSYQKGIWVRKL